MARERRSLWGSISTSRKVNSVSLQAALLYTWAIPHFDDYGFLDGEIEQLKSKIVPLRDEMGKKRLDHCVKELQSIGLWHVFSDNRRIIIYDPSFETHQTFRGIQRKPSKLRVYIQQVNPEWFCSQPQMVDLSTLPTTRGITATREVKGSEVKRREEEIVEISLIKKTLDQEVERIKKIEQEKGHYLGG